MGNPRPVGGRLVSASILFFAPLCRNLYLINYQAFVLRYRFRHRT